MWDLIVSVPDHCLSFYFSKPRAGHFLSPDLSLFPLDQTYGYGGQNMLTKLYLLSITLRVYPFLWSMSVRLTIVICLSIHGFALGRPQTFASIYLINSSSISVLSNLIYRQLCNC